MRGGKARTYSGGMESGSEDEVDYDYLYKLVLIGDSGVGKSNLLSRFVRNEFNLETKTTIGVEFSTKNVTVQNEETGKKVVKAQIWDTAGQERYRALTHSFYRGAVGVLIVFDITSKPSFDHVDLWLNEVRQQAEPNVLVFVIGNKRDLENLRQVDTESAVKYCKDQGLAFMEASALDSTNVDEAFQQLIT